MSWLGAVLVLVGVYLAFKLVGAALKLLMWVLVLVGGYWFLAPYMGWPSLSDVVYVLGPDFGGKRIEQVMQPSEIAGEVGERVVDGVLDRIDPATSEEQAQADSEPSLPASSQDGTAAESERPLPLPEADASDTEGVQDER